MIRISSGGWLLTCGTRSNTSICQASERPFAAVAAAERTNGVSRNGLRAAVTRPATIGEGAGLVASKVSALAGSVGDVKIEELGFAVTTCGESLSCEQSNELQELNLHVEKVDEEREYWWQRE